LEEGSFPSTLFQRGFVCILACFPTLRDQSPAKSTVLNGVSFFTKMGDTTPMIGGCQSLLAGTSRFDIDFPSFPFSPITSEVERTNNPLVEAVDEDSLKAFFVGITEIVGL
jgi:hypothetical protein